MKKIILVGAAPIGGTMRYPSDGVIETSPEAADDLVKAGLAIVDDLETAKVEDLRAVAEKEGVPVGPAALKADLIVAIRARRQNTA